MANTNTKTNSVSNADILNAINGIGARIDNLEARVTKLEQKPASAFGGLSLTDIMGYKMMSGLISNL